MGLQERFVGLSQPGEGGADGAEGERPAAHGPAKAGDRDAMQGTELFEAGGAASAMENFRGDADDDAALRLAEERGIEAAGQAAARRRSRGRREARIRPA